MKYLLRRWRRTRIYSPRGKNKHPAESMDFQKERSVVMGVSKRVVVVKSPNPNFFEQAFFIVREDAPSNGNEILREAQNVADQYVKDGMGRRFSSLKKYLPLFIAGGVLAAMIAGTLALHYAHLAG